MTTREAMTKHQELESLMSDYKKTQPAKRIGIIKVPGGIKIIAPVKGRPARNDGPIAGPARPSRPIGGC
ncbi:hypothetical protein [Streptomyces malaysiensis]|nr:hypothetical protein [Streptomyces malaysiensis]MCC4319600.1 hypothetical protein [Streptomyces malaysiensis]MCQ6248602.1 hypothetical protein [Streptomyces malaysiensis]